MPNAQPGQPPVPVQLFDVEIRRTQSDGRVKIDSVPPEAFPGGPTGYVAAMVECLRLYRNVFVVLLDALDRALALAERFAAEIRAEDERVLQADRQADRPRADSGSPQFGIVELPVEWVRDDAVYLSMHRFQSLRPYTPPEAVFDIFADGESWPRWFHDIRITPSSFLPACGTSELFQSPSSGIRP